MFILLLHPCAGGGLCGGDPRGGVRFEPAEAVPNEYPSSAQAHPAASVHCGAKG